MNMKERNWEEIQKHLEGSKNKIRVMKGRVNRLTTTISYMRKKGWITTEQLIEADKYSYRIAVVKFPNYGNGQIKNIILRKRLRERNGKWVDGKYIEDIN